MIDPERSESIAAALRDLLRAHLGRAELEFADGPARLFGGNHTFVHAFSLAGAEPPWDGPLVLRILRAHRAADEVVFETALQNALAPLAPRVLVHDVDTTPLGGAFQVMERVPGKALLLEEVGQDVGRLHMLGEALRGFRKLNFDPWPERMAETHARVHALPVEPVTDALDAVGMGARVTLTAHLDRLGSEITKLDVQGLRPAHAWLCDRAPKLAAPFSVCHGDLFPNQIFASDGAVTHVIDWADTLLAPGSFDVGYVCAGIEMIPFPIPGAGAIQRRLMRRFCTAYAAQRPLDSGAFAFGEVLRSLHALLAHGRHRAGCGPVPIPYESPAAIRRLEARLVRHGAGGRLDPGHPSV